MTADSASIPSYERVNYMLRPRKQIERKILAELLGHVPDISKYEYIGLGSIFYLDFLIFHKALNIRRMISLEDRSGAKRCAFNKPYDFIVLRAMKTTDFLDNSPKLRNSILWLDYDGRVVENTAKGSGLSEMVLEDLKLVCYQAESPTLVFLTVNVKIKRREYDSFIDSARLYLDDSLQGPEYKATTDDSFKYQVQNILLNYVSEQQKRKGVRFFKLCSFAYQDRASMYTLCGLLDSETHGAEMLKYMRRSDFLDEELSSITSINVPVLTYREKQYLDARINLLKKNVSEATTQRMREAIVRELKFSPGPFQALADYVRYYKYYPQYYEGVI